MKEFLTFSHNRIISEGKPSLLSFFFCVWITGAR